MTTPNEILEQAIEEIKQEMGCGNSHYLQEFRRSKAEEILVLLSIVRQQLLSLKEQMVCPECRGKKLDLTIKHKMDAPDIIVPDAFPCPGCRGEGTYKAWAEKQIAERERQIERLKNLVIEGNIKLGEAFERGKEFTDENLEQVQRIADLTAENERLKDVIRNYESKWPELKDDFEQQMADKNKLIEKLADRLRLSNDILKVPRTEDSGISGTPTQIIWENEAALAEKAKEKRNVQCSNRKNSRKRNS